MILMCEYIIVTQVHWDDGAHRWRGQWKRVPNQTAQVDPFEHPFTLDGWNTIAPCSRSYIFGYLDGWDTIAPYSQSHIFAGSTTRRRLQNMVLKVSLRWSTLTRLTSQELNIEKIKPLPNSQPDQKQNSFVIREFQTFTLGSWTPWTYWCGWQSKQRQESEF